MMPEQCLTIPLQELVASGCLTKCTFAFNNEDDSGIKRDRIDQLLWVNAAKLSLLMAQTLKRFDDKQTGIHSTFTSLKLENFVVELSFKASGTIGRDGVGDKTHHPDTNNDNFLPLVIKHDPSSGDENHDIIPLDYNDDHQFTANDESLQLLSHFFEANDCSKISFQQGNVVAPLELEPNNGKSSSVDTDQPSSGRLPSGIDIFQEINAVSEGETNWTLRGMGIQPNTTKAIEESLQNQPNQDLLKKKHLGKLIYEVFSPRDENKTLPAIFETLLFSDESDTDYECNDEIDLGQGRHKKLQRHKDKSFFSDLLESGNHYPVSICRLLADSPSTKIEDVIEDLGQMSSNPHLYLYDPEDGFFRKLRFGRGCFGRTKQVKKILEVASNLEGSNKREKEQSSSDCANAIFVSGTAGSGKSFLVQRVGDYLISQHWIVVRAKFQKGLEHESQDVVLSAFDNLVKQVVNMREGANEEDIKYGHNATKAILDLLDKDCLASLASRLPNLKWLVKDVDGDCIGAGTAESEKGNSYWRQVFLLSSLLGAILSVDRQVMIYYDDLQWSDSTTLCLINEVMISMSRLPDTRNRFLFVGMYRDDEVTDTFTIRYDSLQHSKNVNITSIHLPSMSKDDITEMIMSELRLPKRIILHFSDVIHKKTSGHALFVVQLLNSLVRDNIVVYNPTKHRYDWDRKQLNELQTCDSVASLIISNFKKLPPEALSSLRVLSCFGMDIHESTIQRIVCCSDTYVCGDDIIPSLPILVDAGILESSEAMTTFAHDMIRQKVYDEIPNDKRQQIHLSIGLFLGSIATLDAPIEDRLSNCNRECDDKEKKEALGGLATDHINNASELVVDHSQRSRFAGWNLIVATESSRNSNFQSAFHYYKSGIAFLGSEWTGDTHELCYSLYQGAAFAGLAVGEAESVPKYANAIIQNVPFERSLEAQCLLIRSQECIGSKTQETVDTALAVLGKVGVHIPFAPHLYLGHPIEGVSSLAPSIVLQSMDKTNKIASKYTLDELVAHQAVKVDKSKVGILSILDSVILAGYRLGSPYLALIVCETVNYSLQQKCVCGHSALSFCYFGYMHIWLRNDHKAGLRWGKLALKILERAKQRNPFIRTRIMVNFLVLIWHQTLRVSAQEMFKAYELGMKSGDVSGASLAIYLHLQYLFMEGENLSSLREKNDHYIKQVVKFNKETAKILILHRMCLDFLIGVPCESFSIFDGMIYNEASLLADALSNKNRMLVSSIYFRRHIEAFWGGQYVQALKWSKIFSDYAGKVSGPRMVNVFLYASLGVVFFQLYREGEGNIYYDRGKGMLKTLEKGLQDCSNDLFNNKLLLLQAEHYAANCEVEKAKAAYEASIQTAKKFRRVNDEALAYELQGKYLSSIVDSQASQSYNKSYRCYMKWGALAKAKMIKETHHVDVKAESNPMKQRRDW